jgi:hypothetical protein
MNKMHSGMAKGQLSSADSKGGFNCVVSASKLKQKGFANLQGALASPPPPPSAKPIGGPASGESSGAK